MYLGFRNRREYVLDLAEEYGVPEDVALAVADILGEGEDEDGLVTTLQDYEALTN